MSDDPPQARSLVSGDRFSLSSAASSRTHLERHLAMTPLQRVGLALALGRRHAELMRRRRDTTGGAR